MERPPESPDTVTHPSEADEPAWHLYEEVFESGAVHLELCGVSEVLSTREQGGPNVVLRLPIETAKQLGLHTIVSPERWERACGSEK
ncbi:hypothetical protein CYD94_03160 [Ralstonia solanacearum]|uniref:Uncharacterized protein n=2 Tax=Ralstonia solanacearum species complex TaxID=3116862 RepID=A0A0S4V0S3_RALSL|nr:hypothetical protein CIG66_15835 [Ralstonia pseudosolanacearum]AUS41318.1 hypothetical protein CYD94_03160 [Ralstonia solanacearum]AVV67747.1 hypothetical protein RSOE_08860 [Ralstonia solanacearum OE1-1]AYA47880.1 hypothetical protein RSP824_16175 [Ralstonia pseudosolanacearum]RAA09006.1 hypothetical protein DOT67_18035 [Ralstonia pseudosolanacearum]